MVNVSVSAGDMCNEGVLPDVNGGNNPNANGEGGVRTSTSLDFQGNQMQYGKIARDACKLKGKEGEDGN